MKDLCPPFFPLLTLALLLLTAGTAHPQWSTNSSGIHYSSGNVGIGTNNPAARLDILLGGWNNIPRAVIAQQADNPSIRLYRPTGSGNAVYYWRLEENNLGNLNFFSGSASSSGSETVGAPALTLKFGGNVGIGTTDPKNRLSVKGTVWAEKVKVQLTDAADWVFADGYYLMPLEKVDAYIKEHGHLPDMPSAEEFRRNDMEVSDMSNRLLQKVEELTLHLIEQEKRIRELEGQNARLRRGGARPSAKVGKGGKAAAVAH